MKEEKTMKGEKTMNGEKTMKRSLLLLLLMFAVPLGAFAQAVAQGEVIELTAEIVAIDKDARIVALEDEDGYIEEIYCGPAVARFDELKVGDEVTFQYSESLVSAILKPGDPSPPDSDDTLLVRGGGDKPSGAIAEQMTATVTIVGIDLAEASLTVETDDDLMMSFPVADAELLEGVDVGDRVEIIYTVAVVITVSS